MSNHRFDPYHKWLGIPPKDQPPNHYRLLGIERFESDAEVIEAAANRLMAYLQDLSTGKYTDEAQRLLGEVAVARLCLLNPKRKQAYDTHLLDQLAADKTSQDRPREPQPQAAAKKRNHVARPQQSTPPRRSAPVELPMLATEPRASIARRKRRTPAWMAATMIVSLLVMIASAGVIGYRHWRQQQNETAAVDSSPVTAADPNANPPAETTARLTIEWPESQRANGQILVNGFSRPIPAEGPIELTVNPGRIDLVLKRPDYEEVREAPLLAAGQERRLSPVWIPTQNLASSDEPPAGTHSSSDPDNPAASTDPGGPSVGIANLPAAVSLPEAADQTGPVNLFPLAITARERMELELLGGREVLGSSGRFELQVLSPPGEDPVWQVVLRNSSGQWYTVAWFGQVNDQFVFQWADGDRPEDADLLRNCGLAVVLNDERRTFALRTPEVLAAAHLAGPRGVADNVVEIPYLPDPSVIELTVLAVRSTDDWRRDEVTEIIPAGQETEFVLAAENSDYPLSTRLNLDPRRGAPRFILRSRLQYRHAGRWQFLNPAEIDKIVAELKPQHEQMGKNLDRVDRPGFRPETTRFDPFRELRQRYYVVGREIDYLERLLELCRSTNPSLHIEYRLTAVYDGYRVLLGTTQIDP